MKSFRLAIFNIKKHKLEAAWLVLLIAICMTLLTSAVLAISGSDRIVDNSFKRNECVHNYIMMKERDYKEAFEDFYKDNEDITSYAVTNMVYDQYIKYIDGGDEERSLFMGFITMDSDERIEKLVLESSHNLDQIRTMEHFVLMPYYAKDTLGFKEGDSFRLLCNEKVYPFTVAGFYESGIFTDAAMGVKFIISDKDYDVLSRVLGEQIIIGFEVAEGVKADQTVADFINYVDEKSMNGESNSITGVSYEMTRLLATANMKTLMGFMIAMSVVVLIAVLFIIRYRIKNSIEEQVVSIGVLEALGYTAKEIANTYFYEYGIVALPSIILGGLLSIFTTPLLLRAGEIMSGHHGAQNSFSVVPVFLGIFLLGFILLVSALKARQVRKYPPVVAFRKGMTSHTYRKNVLPLEKTGKNVHVRLAMKGFLTNMGTNIGMGSCIAVAVIAMVVCSVLNSYLGSGVNALKPMLGTELPDVSVVATVDTDEKALREEILALPEVRKINLTNNFISSMVRIKDTGFFIFAYEDYDQTENIKVMSGRFPKHENEIMVSQVASIMLGIRVGDTITASSGKLEADYLVCGTVNAQSNGGANAYMTVDGYKVLRPSLRATNMEIYLNDGVDRDAFKEHLYELYSTPLERHSATEEKEITGTLEERIQKTAEEKIASLLEMYGVTSVDYAIMIGDQLITGDNSKFKINSGLDLREVVETQMANTTKAYSMGTKVFDVIAIIVITVIIILLMQSAVRKQRKDLGIMKGMGFTNGELMLQMAGKIIPMLVCATLIGSVLGAIVGKLLFITNGDLPISVTKILLMNLFVIALGSVVAFLSANKIKSISVYELMQE